LPLTETGNGLSRDPRQVAVILSTRIEAFEEAAASARHAREPADYRAAIELYAGELLPQERYEVWAEERRAQLRGAYLSLLVELAGVYEERGDSVAFAGAVLPTVPSRFTIRKPPQLQFRTLLIEGSAERLELARA
jgi:hypothetical protein